MLLAPLNECANTFDVLTLSLTRLTSSLCSRRGIHFHRLPRLSAPSHTAALCITPPPRSSHRLLDTSRNGSPPRRRARHRSDKTRSRVCTWQVGATRAQVCKEAVDTCDVIGLNAAYVNVRATKHCDAHYIIQIHNNFFSNLPISFTSAMVFIAWWQE